MRRSLNLVAAVAVAAVSIRCSSSTPAGPAPVAASHGSSPAQLQAMWTQAIQSAIADRANSSAVLDGFRVHPDPGGDGIIHVMEGDGVVVNAADIASRPPAPVTYLVVNWGDSGNDRISCGACRLTHAYKAGRYTVVATTDDLQPGSATRSTTFTVDVQPLVVETPRRSPFKGVAFTPNMIRVGETSVLFQPISFPFPTDIVIDNIVFVCTVPPFPISFGPPTFTGDGVSQTITGVAVGNCRIEFFSHDSSGDQFHDGTFLYVTP